MQVKTFEALNIKDAVKAVKREFGQNAIILSTREKSINGEVNGHEQGRMVEVTAAVPESHSPDKEIPFSTPMFPQTKHGADIRGTDIAGKLDHLDLQMSSLFDRMPAKTNVQHLETGLQEVKLLLLEALRTKEGSTIKNLPAHLVNLDRSLRSMGIEDIHIAKLVQHLLTLSSVKQPESGQLSLEEFYRAQAIRWMLKKIKVAPQWTVMDGHMSIQAFVGSTGVGKTTTISKLAAHYFVKKKKKVALVSLDPYRLGASEKLRIYAKIIGVPFIAINQPEELQKKVLEHKDIELVLIDTSGYSSKNTSLSGQLEALRKLELPIDIHLVLSVTDKEEQMDRTVRCFSQTGIQSLVFTKMDDSWSFGSVFNISQRWSLPLSFFSTGQEVPDDIERATRERVVERIFGL